MVTSKSITEIKICSKKISLHCGHGKHGLEPCTVSAGTLVSCSASQALGSAPALELWSFHRYLFIWRGQCDILEGICCHVSIKFIHFG